jgi:nucleotide-binding universal stress UspA family protein
VNGVNDVQRVVVGVDGSEASRVAIRWAMAEAALRGARLEALHAWRAPMLFVPLVYSPELVEMGRMDEAALDFVARELDAVGADADCGIMIEQTEVEAYPSHALIEASSRAQLVVVGRHGQGGFPHEVIGPKAVQVAHHAVCPVAVVPDEWTGDGRGVVVGVDGSAPAAAALRWSVEEAGRRQAPLTAVMAWGLLDQHHRAGEEPFDPHYSEKDAQAALDAFVSEVAGLLPSPPVETVVVNDLAARGLLERAEGAELLVVGARGLGGFGDLLLGSISHRCLAHARCPTVVVR